MKKILVSTLLLGFGVNIFAQSVNENIQNTIKEMSGIDTKVLSVNNFESVSGMAIATIDVGSEIIPIFASTDGKSVWAIGQFYQFSSQKDSDMMVRKVAEIEEKNKGFKSGKIDEMLKTLPKDGFVNIDAKIKTNKLLTIVTDPDCPYCRNELNNLEKHLEETNVRVVFASVHDQKAFVKAKLILDETKKLKPTDRDKIVAVFKKYYRDISLTDEQMRANTTVVETTTRTIFSSGLIRGVPYIHEGTR
ncbi:MAG: hypothetical protein LBG67_05745 [Campylobacteraceae bacterium]|nr:hypothetical protein [Campylobacteraceae bacterium]